MKRAASAGIQFTAEQILELSQCEADEGLYMILETSSCTFSQTQLDDIYFETGNDNVFAERYLKLLKIREFVCRECVMKNQRKLHHNANISAPVF